MGNISSNPHTAHVMIRVLPVHMRKLRFKDSALLTTRVTKGQRWDVGIQV